jgi:hypothetical protein
MVAEKDVETIKKELASDTRDVADLWTDALRKYKGIVGEDLVPKFANVDAMIAFGTQEMNNFHSFRHSQKKVDKLRSLFAANLDYIAKGSQQLIAAATPAFPPAAAIGTALTYMLSVRGPLHSCTSLMILIVVRCRRASKFLPTTTRSRHFSKT